MVVNWENGKMKINSDLKGKKAWKTNCIKYYAIMNNDFKKVLFYLFTKYVIQCITKHILKCITKCVTNCIIFLS